MYGDMFRDAFVGMLIVGILIGLGIGGFGWFFTGCFIISTLCGYSYV